MNTSFNKNIKMLKEIANRFDAESNSRKLYYLKQLSAQKLSADKSLINYFEVLLFLCAYPFDKKMLAIAESELTRITRFLKNIKKKADIFINSGLPYTNYISCFTHDFVRWLLNHPHCKLSINRFNNTYFDLNEVLKLTLPSLEKSETTAGFDNSDLLESLMIKKQNQIKFLITELSKLDPTPNIKDHFYDGLGVYLNIQPKTHLFSRAYNRLAANSTFYHNELIKHFDHKALLKNIIPESSELSGAEKKQIIYTVKNSMALTDRETDTVTYIDESSLRLYELERGINIVIYNMIPERQLPLESYVGYTLFKNGFPAAYGGAWVFGECSNFGINIFESFRGGESGYIMCQLLRVYKQVFGINYFEIEPYQFGLDNPEGIESGAFWFYYRYGFRPLTKTLLKIANNEQKKFASKKNYRTSKKTLEKFTESNMELKLKKNVPVKVPDITSKVSKMIEQQYNGNRLQAVEDCLVKFKYKMKTQANNILNKNEMQVMQEVALWSEAFKLTDKSQLLLIEEMIKTKPMDVYKYQQLLLRFFNYKKLSNENVC